jgi:uncharacterized protein YfaS (alpha-2-macroglobulin family)
LLQEKQDGSGASAVATPVKGEPVKPVPSWKDIDRLVDEQKFQAALDAVEIRLQAARGGTDDNELTRALVKATQLRTGLHGYETAVRVLREQAWPQSVLARTTLRLFYAHALVTYAEAYSWEIGQRERVESSGVLDLKAWTRDEIVAEALRAYGEVWRDRESFGAETIAVLGEYLEANDYPPEVRGTLRDAFSYLTAELLADTSFWSPEQSNDLHLTDLAKLLTPRHGATAAAPDDTAAHPLARLAAVLGDLESWHASAGRREAALEARLELARRLHAAFDEDDDRAAIIADLERRLPGYREVAWWAAGMAQLAEFVRETDDVDNLARARKLALQGAEAYPKTLGGRRCAHLAAAIAAPDYSLESMTADGAGKRSLLVNHRNLTSLNLRAYEMDLVRRVETARDYNLLPDADELRALVRSKQPVASWQVDLPATPDYRSHRTFVTPPLTKAGFYVIVASPRADFKGMDSRVLAAAMNVTDLVLVTGRDDDGGAEVRVLSGTTGAPLAGVEVALYRFDWQQGHRRIEARTAGDDGLVRFEPRFGREAGPHFLLARRGAEHALEAESLWFQRREESQEASACLIYTDRSIYRPQQKVLWKVLAYRGRGEVGSYWTLAGSPVTVSLLDANGQTVESATLATNRFGTAAGEFVLPAGRALGVWRLSSSLGGSQVIRVEEYKRPTFEVAVKDPTAPLRLNREARLTGEARYYFGLPVTAGQVRWRVTREPVMPPWWGWWWGRKSSARSVQTIASGTATLAEDGRFEVAFTPRADERLAADEKVTYRFALAADVSDEGGETRSAKRVFRLGFVAVDASIETDSSFFRSGAPARLTVRRTSLDGVARPGPGSWRLVSLVQPPAALTPADQKRTTAPRDEPAPGVETAGDRLRARWETGVTVEEVLRNWPAGEELRRGTVDHDAAGEAAIDLGTPPPGAYRLTYETRDEFGATCEATRDLVVAGHAGRLAVPLVVWREAASVPVGGTARLLVHSGLANQPLFLDVFSGGVRVERRRLTPGSGLELIEIPVTAERRGGFGVSVTGVRDHQFLQATAQVFVPWDDRALEVSFASFRDNLRPGGRETWRVTVKGAGAEASAAELLAYMYDKSLDVFAPHVPPDPRQLYPNRAAVRTSQASLGVQGGTWLEGDARELPEYPQLEGDSLKFYDSYGIGGPGRRITVFAESVAMAPQTMRAMPAPAAPMAKSGPADEADGEASGEDDAEAPPPEVEPPQLRADFAETAFWKPQLLTGEDGSAAIEFTVPDSVTAWNVWVHAVTRDLKAGSLHREARSVKEVMVRPYLPRFLREGDQAELRVVVNNASDRELEGSLTFDLLDPAGETSLLGEFGLTPAVASRAFTVKGAGSTSVAFAVTAPKRVGAVAVKVIATAGDLSDGELRVLPLLPGRVHLSQSRFVTLRDADRRTMRFDDLARDDDPTRVNEQMVVTVDAQLFYTVLAALPYLVDYPYECTEQTLNRFVSTGIVSTLYDDYPVVGKMAAELAKRDTRLETFDAADPNRKMALEETPWLVAAQGGTDAGHGLTNVLDPRIAKAERDTALAKLRKAQTANGAFPWWPGGPPSPYMTLYIMHGLAKAAEFGIDVPRDMVQRGWNYLGGHFRADLRRLMAEDCCWEFLTFLNYVATCYPDASWTGNALPESERREILAFSFKHWKQHSPYLKGYLALTLARMGRENDARAVWSSVMDSAKTTQDEGTFWAPEDRAWLWYNDTIESHAFALRALMELEPGSPHRDGLVQWLLLNKKLNQWKSTRATAEVVYSLVHYLTHEGTLGVPEDATVIVGGRTVRFTFSPESYTGRKNQVVIPAAGIDPSTTSTVIVEKTSKGFAFASATWQFSTERLPTEDRGDFFTVSRRYFKREGTPAGFVLKPLSEGAPLAVGDQVEVQVSLSSKHEAEYVHLRDPRAAGLEPENAVSRFKWDLGIGWYEETRDSGSNFFFERLPAGEYTFKYRLRANLAGTFKVAPATVQSMYAPEFNAYSAGATLHIGPLE